MYSKQQNLIFYWKAYQKKGYIQNKVTPKNITFVL